MTTLLSFNNDKKTKLKYVNRMKAHIEADELLQKATGDNGKGCAVWCTLDKYDHKAFETELSAPEWLARLYDTIFEGLPKEDAQKFALQLLQAIPVGVNLEPVKWKFCAFLLKENIERVLALTLDEKLKDQVVASIRGCLSVHENAILSGVWDESAAESARSARSAWSAAESARSAGSAESAESAAWSAGSAAWSAAWSAAESARSAARSAAWSAAWSAESAARSAGSAAYQRYAAELIRILKAERKTK